MKNNFTNHLESLALKELGFDEPCLAFYKNDLTFQNQFDFEHDNEEAFVIQNSKINPLKAVCTAPLYSQAFKFFKNKYNLHQHLQPIYSSHEWEYVILDINWGEDKEVHYNCRKGEFITEEEAKLACLQKLIELCKK